MVENEMSDQEAWRTIRMTGIVILFVSISLVGISSYISHISG